MSDIQVNPGEWVEVFDENTSGVFRVYSMMARVVRATSTPTAGGVTLDCDENRPSGLLMNDADGVLKLYLYNSGRTPGYIEKDV